MNHKLEECAYQCERLKLRLEQDCQLPDGSLGGEMADVYRKLRDSHLTQIKKITGQLKILRKKINNL